MHSVLIGWTTGLPEELCGIVFQYTEHHAMMSVCNALTKGACEGTRCHICYDSDDVDFCNTCRMGACTVHSKKCNICLEESCERCMFDGKCTDCITVEVEYNKKYSGSHTQHISCSIVTYISNYRDEYYRSNHNDSIKKYLVNRPISLFGNDEYNLRPFGWKCHQCSSLFCSKCPVYICHKCYLLTCYICVYSAIKCK